MEIPRKEVIVSHEIDWTIAQIIGLVPDPALKSEWMKFSDETIELELEAIEEKRMLYGPLMIPNKDILRKDEKGNPFYAWFSEASIEVMATKFAKNNFNNNVAFRHTGKLVKGTLIESFIIKPGMVVLGFESLPVGTWMGTTYIEDKAFWDEFIKTDLLKGFSLEIKGMVEEIQLSEITEDDFMEHIRNILLDGSKINDLKNLVGTDKSWEEKVSAISKLKL